MATAKMLPMLTERQANFTDFDFIHGGLLYGARKGHYAVNTESKAMLSCLKQEVRSVITQNCLLDGRSALARVFLEGNCRVANLITCEHEVGSQAFEIYALTVAKKYQGQGFGSQVLDAAMVALSSVVVYARCSVASGKMLSMLEKRGFRVNTTDNDFTVLVRHTPQVNDFEKPLYLNV